MESTRQRMCDSVELGLMENCIRREYKRERTVFAAIRTAVGKDLRVANRPWLVIRSSEVCSADSEVGFLPTLLLTIMEV